MNPLIQGKSGTTPVMSRNAFSTNQGTNEDDFQSDPHPEAGIFGNQTMRKCGQKDRRDTIIWISSSVNGIRTKSWFLTSFLTLACKLKCPCLLLAQVSHQSLCEIILKTVSFSTHFVSTRCWTKTRTVFYGLTNTRCNALK